MEWAARGRRPYVKASRGGLVGRRDRGMGGHADEDACTHTGTLRLALWGVPSDRSPRPGARRWQPNWPTASWRSSDRPDFAAGLLGSSSVLSGDVLDDGGGPGSERVRAAAGPAALAVSHERVQRCARTWRSCRAESEMTAAVIEEAPGRRGPSRGARPAHGRPEHYDGTTSESLRRGHDGRGADFTGTTTTLARGPATGQQGITEDRLRPTTAPNIPQRGEEDVHRGGLPRLERPGALRRGVTQHRLLRLRGLEPALGAPMTPAARVDPPVGTGATAAAVRFVDLDAAADQRGPEDAVATTTCRPASRKICSAP